MARMIPSFVDESSPPGERDVFAKLQSGPDDWVVIHSVDIAAWNHRRRTEIDFVVIVPDSGILCIEVKSHESIWCENGNWFPDSIRLSPFKQAENGRFALLRGISGIAPDISLPPVVHLCIFSSAEFELKPNLNVMPHELMDCRAFQQLKFGDQFCADLRKRVHAAIESESLKPMTRALRRAETERLTELMYPVRKRRPDELEEVNCRRAELEKHLRAQQKPVLALCDNNSRVLVRGAAGTGKSLIALEVARRKAEQGLRTGLLCFNRLMGEWVDRELRGDGKVPPNLVWGSAIKVMADMTGIDIPENPASSFWRDDLPDKILDKLTDPGFRNECVFDALVLDEAQDLLAQPKLLECLHGFLNGGLRCGDWVLLGDFRHQALVNQASVDITLKDILDAERPAVWTLDENCRNYGVVGNMALALSGLPKNVYTGFMRGDGVPANYDIFFYNTEDEQRTSLKRCLEEFWKSGPPHETVVLSCRRPSESIAARTAEDFGGRLQPFRLDARGSSGYTSVHAFKGLESRNVIVTDVDLTGPDFERYVFYTAMTRATGAVRVLCERSSGPRLRKMLAKAN